MNVKTKLYLLNLALLLPYLYLSAHCHIQYYGEHTVERVPSPTIRNTNYNHNHREVRLFNSRIILDLPFESAAAAAAIPSDHHRYDETKFERDLLKAESSQLSAANTVQTHQTSPYGQDEQFEEEEEVLTVGRKKFLAEALMKKSFLANSREEIEAKERQADVEHRVKRQNQNSNYNNDGEDEAIFMMSTNNLTSSSNLTTTVTTTTTTTTTRPRPFWSCEISYNWTEFSDDYFPKLVKNYSCATSSCAYDTHTCEPRLYGIKLLKRIAGTEDMPDDTVPLSLRSNWTTEFLTITTCCDCVPMEVIQED